VVWGPYEENPPFYVPRRAVAGHLGIEEGPVPSRHSMSAPGTLKDILVNAGFEKVEERALRYKNQVDDIDDYVTRNLKRSFVKETENLSDTEFDSLKQALLAAWEPYVEEGVLQVPNYARLGIGWKSA